MSDSGVFAEVGLRIAELRGGRTQADFAAQIGVDRKTVVRWEAGERLPDGASLLALAQHFGADLNYLLTGVTAGKPQAKLSAEERVMLDYFRDAPPTVRKAALGALLSAAPGASHTQTAGAHSQNNIGDDAVQIGRSRGKVNIKRS